MTVTPSSFRSDFPEFGNVTVYPDSQVNLYITLAVVQVTQPKWGAYTDYGTELFVAHYLSIENQEAKSVARGGTPGMRPGAIASEGVGPASVSYDNASATLKDGGDFNKTTYGIRFLKMRREIGVGGVQV